MKIAVTDANIFIDILFIDLHEFLSLLDLEIYTTSLVLAELDDGQIAKLKGIIVYEFSDEEHTSLEQFILKKGLSDADHSVIFLAEVVSAIVISGDSLVRKTCQERKLEVHGILWLLDECIRLDHLSSQDARLKLQNLMKVNNRLPKKDCDERLEKWNLQ